MRIARIIMLTGLLLIVPALAGCSAPKNGGDAETLDGKDSLEFTMSNQNCAAGQVVTGVSAAGMLTCAVDKAGDGASNLASQACAAGMVVTGIAADDTLTCAADADTVDGGDAATLAGAAPATYRSFVAGTDRGDVIARPVGHNDATNTIYSLTVTAPTAGFVVLNGYLDWDGFTTSYISIQKNDSTCTDVPKSSQVAVASDIASGGSDGTMAVTGMTSVSAGANTFYLCGGQTGAIGIQNYGITAIFTPATF